MKGRFEDICISVALLAFKRMHTIPLGRATKHRNLDVSLQSIDSYFSRKLELKVQSSPIKITTAYRVITQIYSTESVLRLLAQYNVLARSRVSVLRTPSEKTKKQKDNRLIDQRWPRAKESKHYSMNAPNMKT